MDFRPRAVLRKPARGRGTTAAFAGSACPVRHGFRGLRPRQTAPMDPERDSPATMLRKLGSPTLPTKPSLLLASPGYVSISPAFSISVDRPARRDPLDHLYWTFLNDIVLFINTN
ncbi:hypothetical protein DPMN_173530 [Dreissena polymorpha]|uniref:Uncharacterized protein n=1 Tax=Dreissena polymorpha TaxID=45954 RepID=A0A9D4IH09_DREPO|nr:hypothetical protein DPMN_173530 [Dreissena polymorpha]